MMCELSSCHRPRWAQRIQLPLERDLPMTLRVYRLRKGLYMATTLFHPSRRWHDDEAVTAKSKRDAIAYIKRRYSNIVKVVP